MLDKIWKKIEQYDDICIFRHVNPDGDAYGSQYGLGSYLKETFPNKNVYCLGHEAEEKFGIFPKNDDASDDIIKKSLVFILDTSTKERIDDKRALLAQDIIVIDHHRDSVKLSDYYYVKDNRASCSELVCELIAYRTPLDTLSEITATYLYTGIDTDTKDFSTNNTTYESFEIASKLVKCGVKPSEVHYNVTKKSKEMMAFTSEFNTKMIILDNGLGYGFVTLEMQEKYGLSTNVCKNAVNEFDIIDGVNVWACFTEKEKGIYSVGLRSRGIAVNTIANKYGGGGHICASGADNLSIEQVNNIIIDLNKAINEKI